MPVEVRDLHKSYGAIEAVKNVSFVVEVGEVFALLGPNGAGKTTTVEILEGYPHPHGGRRSASSASTRPRRSRALRKRIGIVLQGAASSPT